MSGLRTRRVGRLVFLALAGLAAVSPRCSAENGEFARQAPLIAEQIAKSGKQRIAVVDFTDLQGNVTELGRFLAEALSVSLAAAAKGFDVIDRTHLENLLAEHRLSARGLIDPQTSQRLKVAGVQGLLTGTVIPMGDSVRLTLKVLDVETAKISAPTEIDIPKTPAIQALIESSVESAPRLPSSAGGTDTEPSHRRQIVKNVSFDLRSCRAIGGRALCALTVTSLEADGPFSICNSRVMDEEGSEFGSDETWVGGANRSSANLVAAVPMSLRLSFRLPAKASKIALLEISFNYGSACIYGWEKVQYRAVPLSR